MKEAPKPAAEAKGLVCPNCGCQHFYVVYTRPRAEKIVRRKECRHCGRRILTCERLLGGTPD